MLEEGVNGAHYYSDHAYAHVLDFLYITYPGAALRHATHTVHWAFEHVSYVTLQKFGLYQQHELTLTNATAPNISLLLAPSFSLAWKSLSVSLHCSSVSSLYQFQELF
jgi:hypothetical protein